MYDGGHLIIEAEEYAEFIGKEPDAVPFIKKLVGAQEFINNRSRYCLWLVGVSPAQLRNMPEVMKRIQACKQDREAAPDPGRRKLALTPHLFRETGVPETHYILVPRVSSENRRYVPIGFVAPEIIATDSAHIIPDASIYHFGILTSNVHNAWAVCSILAFRASVGLGQGKLL